MGSQRVRQSREIREGWWSVAVSAAQTELLAESPGTHEAYARFWARSLAPRADVEDRTVHAGNRGGGGGADRREQRPSVCGYQASRNFYRAFATVLGIRPGQLRLVPRDELRAWLDAQSALRVNPLRRFNVGGQR